MGPSGRSRRQICRYGFTASLSYTATDAVLNLTAGLGTPGLQPLATSKPTATSKTSHLAQQFFKWCALPPNS
jgi:hypothetical protein